MSKEELIAEVQKTLDEFRLTNDPDCLDWISQLLPRLKNKL